jgi:hypothetical protein
LYKFLKLHHFGLDFLFAGLHRGAAEVHTCTRKRQNSETGSN